GTVRILQKIGSGGMGSVYKGMEIENSRRVGIKILHPKLANRKDLVSRFGREAGAPADPHRGARRARRSPQGRHHPPPSEARQNLPRPGPRPPRLPETRIPR